MKKKISIIVATKNRGKILEETAFKNIQVARFYNCEYIIVNDGDDFVIDLPNDVIILDNKKQGVSKARNAGAAKASGEILFFLDDDMWINNQAIEWINNCFAIEKNSGSIYNINWEYPPSLADKLHQSKIGNYILFTKYNTMWGRMHAPGSQPAQGLYVSKSIASGSLVMDKTIFAKLGGYNEFMLFQGEDIDLTNRANKLNIPVYVVFDVTLYHNQQDRIDVDQYLARLSDGYQSEFKAVKAGIISPLGNKEYKGAEILFFEIFRITERGWIFLLKLMPVKKFTSHFNNKLVGILSGLQRYKQWRIFMR